VMVKVNERRKEVDKNPYDAVIQKLQTSVRKLRSKTLEQDNGVKESWVRLYEEGMFRRIEHDGSRHVMLQGYDCGIIGYIVPAGCLRDIDHVNILSKSIENLPSLSSSSNSEEVDPSLQSSRIYSISPAYNPEQPSNPDLEKHGELPSHFVEEAKPLWSEATEILRDIFPRLYGDFTSVPLPSDLKPMAGAWMGMVAEVGSGEQSVRTEPQRDIMGGSNGMSCLCPLGDYTGGEVILWELQKTVVLRPGDLFFFPDHLVHISTAEVKGVRHSLMAFTLQEILNWADGKRKRKFPEDGVKGSRKKDSQHKQKFPEDGVEGSRSRKRRRNNVENGTEKGAIV
jgi:hypothetical protein